MGGGIHPAEWIFPVVGATHAAYNAAAQTASPRAKVNTPGSSNDRRDDAMERDRNEAEAARQSAAEQLAAMPRPQTAAEEEQSRLRAKAAAASKLGGKRASQYLTDSAQSLGVAV